MSSLTNITHPMRAMKHMYHPFPVVSRLHSKTFAEMMWGLPKDVLAAIATATISTDEPVSINILSNADLAFTEHCVKLGQRR